MNDDATGWPVSLKNEATPNVTVFSSAATAPTAAVGAASAIVPDAHIPPSGQKQHTKPFYPATTNNMTKKYTINTTPAPDTPTAATADASARSPVSKISNSPYSLRNCNLNPQLHQHEKT